MAARAFTINQGEQKPDVAVSSVSDIGTYVRVVFNTTVTKTEALKHLDIIRAKIHETDWPPNP